jgi:hypothetical protein
MIYGLNVVKFSVYKISDNPVKQIKVFSSRQNCPDGDAKDISELSRSPVIEAG